MDEFELIRRYFATAALGFERDGVALGIGDDAALLSAGSGEQLALSMDMLQAGVHFPPDCDPGLLAQRALRVNLSDLAAMGAEALGFTLALSLPAIDENWLEGFAAGLAEVAQAANCPLIGGDTTVGPLAICIQVHGRVPQGEAMRRGAGRAGDDLYVTGTLGDAAAALALLAPDAAAAAVDTSPLQATQRQRLLDAYYKPALYLEFAQQLRTLANAAIDLSDGLASDLRHVLVASNLDAEVWLEQLPLSAAFCQAVADAARWPLAVSGGDDYGLCFSAALAQREKISALAAPLGVTVTRVGQLRAPNSAQAPGEILWIDAGGQPCSMPARGYRHFVDGQH